MNCLPRLSRLQSLLMPAALALAMPALAAGVENYSGQPGPGLEGALAGKYRIAQIGDSHTASDFFSNAARRHLQSRFGNGGIGYVYPAKANGILLQTVGYSSSGWTVKTSRGTRGDFPLGGVIAQSSGSQGHVTVKLNPKWRESGEQSLAFTVRADSGSGRLTVSDSRGSWELPADPARPGWQRVLSHARIPFTFRNSPGARWSVGGISIENSRGGIVYSATGIPGSLFTDLSRWRTGWQEDLAALSPDLVILSFGTNESFGNSWDLAGLREQWRKQILSIRKALPRARLLLIGSPETLISSAGKCGRRTQGLDRVQAMQRSLASELKLLYWSWQDQGMGGACSMKGWIHSGLAQGDGIHFTVKGYEKAGLAFGRDLEAFLRSR